MVGGSLRCMDGQINELDSPCFLVHYARGGLQQLIRPNSNNQVNKSIKMKK